MAERSDWIIPDELAARIGRFVAAWSGIELTLEAIIWALTGVRPAIGRLFTAPLQVRPKYELINGLIPFHELANELVPLWDEALPAIKILQEARNAVAHHA